MIENLLGKKNLLTTSCTHALEIAALLLKSESDDRDEVIVPAFTFVSTASAFALHGYRVRFADVSESDLNISPTSIESILSDRTRAICTVNYAGRSCDYESIRRLVGDRQIALIEDNAHGFGVSVNGLKLGSIGDFSVQSYHETKNVQCGEGGSIVLCPSARSRSIHVREPVRNLEKKMPANFEAGFFTKTPAWHGLGVVIPEPLLSEEAITVAGLDWTVTKCPIHVPTPSGDVAHPKEWVATVREDNSRVLGVVGPGYQVVQNADAFTFMDEVAGPGKLVRYETAGSLAFGRKVWMLATIADLQIEPIPGDVVKPYLLLANGHDGRMELS
ncbi:MAG: DUF932 domain-containing protein, partial [Actinobacteria bacterium]|nr:DUF932 domain-containing protein [Actinomycetota bacterium]